MGCCGNKSQKNAKISKGVKSTKKGLTVPTSVKKKDALNVDYSSGEKRVIILNGEVFEINN